MERVLHLAAPVGQGGTTWVAYEWLETGETVSTPPIPSEGAGKWYHSRVLPLSVARRSEAAAQQHLLLKVQWKGPSARARDAVAVGRVVLDLGPLFSGLQVGLNTDICPSEILT